MSRESNSIEIRVKPLGEKGKRQHMSGPPKFKNTKNLGRKEEKKIP